MKFYKSISALVIALVIFSETIGVQVIKDICVPCDGERLAVKLAYADYESSCHDSCDAICHAEEVCCGSEPGQHHQHEKEVELFNKNPEFFNGNSSLSFAFSPAVIAVLYSLVGFFNPYVEQIPIYLSYHKTVNSPHDKQSLLCVFMI